MKRSCDICNAKRNLTAYDGGLYCPKCLAEMQEHNARIEDLQQSLEPHLKAWLELHKDLPAMTLEDVFCAIGDKLVQGKYAKALIKEVL
jgi:predicted amidophosphoribosyltransferase